MIISDYFIKNSDYLKKTFDWSSFIKIDLKSISIKDYLKHDVENSLLHVNFVDFHNLNKLNSEIQIISKSILDLLLSVKLILYFAS